jgi:3-hydroxyacyl-CoA dehydrogenase / enoyl-CoA hydratase / 3-hydroxybutyryl-CoA epimerase / enoyl-CoA isomerase
MGSTSVTQSSSAEAIPPKKSSTVRFEELGDRIGLLAIDVDGRSVNALSHAVWNDLLVAVQLAGSKALSGLLIASGKPGQFVAGADLNELLAVMDRPIEVIHQAFDLGRVVLSLLRDLPFPAIALIDGPCLGGGLELALACDDRVAGNAPKTILGLPETTLNLIPGWGGTQRLPRLVGLQAALEMILSGKPITPTDAKTIGLISVLGDREQLISLGRTQLTILNARGDWRTRRLNETATPTANTQDRNLIFEWERKLVGKPSALQAALAVVRDGWNLPLPAGLNLERDEFARILKTPEAREGVAEFLNRRKSPRPST